MQCPHAQSLLTDPQGSALSEGKSEALTLPLDRCPTCRPLGDSSSPALQTPAADSSPASLDDESPLTLLIVEDDPAITRLLSVLLADRYVIASVATIGLAREHLTHQPAQLLLTDQYLPDGTGTDLLCWAEQHCPQTIRLLMTASTNLEDVLLAINRSQVYAYLVKPWRTEDLFQALRNAADKSRLERKKRHYLDQLRRLNEELERRVAERTSELEDANQRLQQHNRELERLALTDPLTGLLNRRAAEDLIRFELKRQTRYPAPLAVGILDIDHFKSVNSRYLLTGGDEVLKGLARLLTATVREVDTVGRLGGEEFILIARDTNASGAATLAERLRAVIEATPVPYQDEAISITASVGFAVAGGGTHTDLHQLTEAAAAALDQAKRGGRNRCEVRSLAAAQAG